VFSIIASKQYLLFFGTVRLSGGHNSSVPVQIRKKDSEAIKAPLNNCIIKYQGF